MMARLIRAAECFALGLGLMLGVGACGALGYVLPHGALGAIAGVIVGLVLGGLVSRRFSSGWLLMPGLSGLVVCLLASMALNDAAAVQAQGAIPEVAVSSLGRQTTDVVRVTDGMRGPHRGSVQSKCGHKNQSTCTTKARSIVPKGTTRPPVVEAWLVQDPRPSRPLAYLRRHDASARVRQAIEQACPAPACATPPNAPAFATMSAPDAIWRDAHVEEAFLFGTVVWFIAVVVLALRRDL